MMVVGCECVSFSIYSSAQVSPKNPASLFFFKSNKSVQHSMTLLHSLAWYNDYTDSRMRNLSRAREWEYV